MPRLADSRLALLDSLDQRDGPPPSPGVGSSMVGSAPFEKIVRVFLGLVAEAKLAGLAFEALRDNALIEPGPLAEADPLEIDDVFQQARVRLASRALRPLQRIARWASDRDTGSFEVLSTEAIREEWRALNGVGPATADSLLLFALDRPTIPVDRASYRILVRHGWLDPSSDYDEARSVLESIAPDDPRRLARLSIAFEGLGKGFCKPSAPKCERCPLRSLLPEGGPVVSED